MLEKLLDVTNMFKISKLLEIADITAEMSPEIQNRGISGPTKKTYVLQYLFKKINDNKKKKIEESLNYLAEPA